MGGRRGARHPVVTGRSPEPYRRGRVLRTGSSLGLGGDSVLAADAFARSAGGLLPAIDRLHACVWGRYL